MTNKKISNATAAAPSVNDGLPIYKYGSTGAYSIEVGDVSGLAGRGHLTASCGTLDTVINVGQFPKGMGANLFWAVIDPYTTECEIRKITAVSAQQLTFATALTYNHAANDAVLLLDKPVVNVKWFGATGDGTTDDATAIQRALDVDLDPASGNSNTVVYLPFGSYIVQTPLNMCDRSQMTVMGEGMWGTTIYGRVGTNKAVIEVIGSHRINFRDLAIKADSTSRPDVGVWTGRSVTSSNSSYIEFKNVYIYGEFNKACYYNCDSEFNFIDQCIFSLNAPATATATCVYTSNNVLGLSSTHTTLNPNTGGVLCEIRNSSILCGTTVTSGRAIYVAGTGGFYNYGPLLTHSYLYCGAGVAAIELRHHSEISFDDLSIEGSGTYGLLCKYDAGATNVYRIKANRGALVGVTSGLYAEDNTTLRDVRMNGCSINGGASVYNCEGSRIVDWGVYSGTAVDFAFRGTIDGTYITKALADTITTDGATISNLFIESVATAYQGGLQIAGGYGLKLGSDATAANMTRVLTATQTWNPGTIANGSAAIVASALTGVAMDGTWVCQAAYTGIVSGGDVWILNAYADSDSVRVVLQNWCGADRTPTGTLRVVAMKVA